MHAFPLRIISFHRKKKFLSRVSMVGPLGRKYEAAKERDNRRIHNVFSDFTVIFFMKLKCDERIDGDDLWARISFIIIMKICR